MLLCPKIATSIEVIHPTGSVQFNLTNTTQRLNLLLPFHDGKRGKDEMVVRIKIRRWGRREGVSPGHINIRDKQTRASFESRGRPSILSISVNITHGGGGGGGLDPNTPFPPLPFCPPLQT